MKTNERPPIWTKNFLSISFVHFIVFVIFYTLLTTLPLYVIYDLGGSEAQGGLVVTAMFITAILVRPISGKIVERIGKRKILISLVIVFAVTTFGYIWIEGFAALLILRLIHGVSFGVLTTATSAIAADVVPDERRGEGLGYFTMSMNLAVVAGPFLGLTLIQFVSFQYLFVILSITMLVGVVCAWIVKTKETYQPAVTPVQRKMTIHDFLELSALPIALMSSLVAFAYSGVISFISVYATELGLEQVSSYFFLVFAITMLVTRPYLGRLFDERGPKIVILPCLIIFASGLLTLSIADSAVLFLVSAGLIGVGYGTLLPCLLSMSVQSSAGHRNSYATATFFMMFDSGIALGSYFLGIFASFTGFSSLFLYSAVFVLILTISFYIVFNKIAACPGRNGKNKKLGRQVNKPSLFLVQNCAVSVDPFIAVVDDVPPEITWDTSSK
ncbi:MFS transporter [Salibacterium salarium]|uniref:MFS transporter n=1 Tax=Salibacterium salarium TaxID=284579 RepID=A0A3R9QH56_9BACI|nr:MFS transporter [Salibacterium salarium]RSL30441.1 MFS transporter [Salibacterium salarium]